MDNLDPIPAEVAKDLVDLVNSLAYLRKDSQVRYGQMKFDYLSLDAILGRVKMCEKFAAGFAVARSLEGVVQVRPVLTHISGYRLAGDALTYEEGKMQTQGKGPQIMGSVITYCKRYAIAAMLGIACDPDTDGTDQLPTPVQPRRQAPAPAPAPAPADDLDLDSPDNRPWTSAQATALTEIRLKLEQHQVDINAATMDTLGHIPWAKKGGVPTESEAADLLIALRAMLSDLDS